MYREIDLSELVIYEAFFKIKGNLSPDGKLSPIRIEMQEVEKMASIIEKRDPTVRVNLGRKSILHLLSKSKHTVILQEDAFIINDVHAPDVRKLFYQYGPSKSTKNLIRNKK
ncbi:MAG: hypothetical protein J6M55_05385 [Paludibacteraceae bacterium]|nr:hypothetical protein [Paludibacteraceae bacterium]